MEMRKLLLSSVCMFLALTAPGSAQATGDWAELGREATLERVGNTVAAVQELMSPDQVELGWYEDVSGAVITEATNMVVSLRNSLVGNPHVRISGFTLTVGVPPSISIDFEFPDPTP